jgi:hypothetical protein
MKMLAEIGGSERERRHTEKARVGHAWEHDKKRRFDRTPSSYGHSSGPPKHPTSVDYEGKPTYENSHGAPKSYTQKCSRETKPKRPTFTTVVNLS